MKISLSLVYGMGKEFEKGEFDTALSFHGTGGIALEDSDFVTFVTPNHLPEVIFIFFSSK